MDEQFNTNLDEFRAELANNRWLEDFHGLEDDKSPDPAGSWVNAGIFDWSEALRLYYKWMLTYGKDAVWEEFKKWVGKAYKSALESEDRSELLNVRNNLTLAVTQLPSMRWATAISNLIQAEYRRNLIPSLLGRLDDKTFEKMVKEIPYKSYDFYFGEGIPVLKEDLRSSFFQPDLYVETMLEIIRSYWSKYELDRCPTCGGPVGIVDQIPSTYYYYHLTPEFKICSKHGIIWKTT